MSVCIIENKQACTILQVILSNSNTASLWMDCKLHYKSLELISMADKCT